MTEPGPSVRIVGVPAVVLQLDCNGGWDHETGGGWPDMPTYLALRRAEEMGYVERSSAYGAACWRLTDEGIKFRREVKRGARPGTSVTAPNEKVPVTETARDATWRHYQGRLGNLTEIEESRIQRAFHAGWRAAYQNGSTIGSRNRRPIRKVNRAANAA
jgi:hypothetical protein